MDYQTLTMRPIQTQVCIVGAGPAGCTLALFLAKHKIAHVLVEKASFPRDKVCGDGLTLEVMHTLSQLDRSLLDALIEREEFHPCWSVCFQAPNGKKLALHFSPEIHPYAPLYTGSRLDFDTFLYDHLDAEYTHMLPSTKVVDIQRTQGKCTLRLETHSGEVKEVSTSLVVGADGGSSIVKRLLHQNNPKVSSPYQGVGIRGYGYTRENVAGMNAMEFLFYRDLLPGYFWVFPMGRNKFNVGVYTTARVLKNKGVKLTDLLDSCIAQYNQSLPPSQQIRSFTGPQTWGLPIRLQPQALGGENYLLLGDAGSLIEPFTGKGIGLAMLSAKVAAQVLARGIKDQSHFPQVYLQYGDAMKRMYSKEYMVSKLLHRTFSFSIGANTVLWLLSRKLLQPHWRRYLQEEIVKWQH